MLYLAYLGVLWGLILVGNVLWGSIPDKIIETFNNCSYAIIAALIATRGWLMSEEQVMKKISNRYTYIICILIAIIMTLSFVQYQRSDNVNEQQNTTFENRKNDYLISSDSVVYDICNNVKSATNDTLNNTRKIKSKANDSLQIKKTMNANTKNLQRKKQMFVIKLIVVKILFQKKHYLCIKVGTRLCETLQNGAEIRWSNSRRLCLLRFFNAKI